MVQRGQFLERSVVVRSGGLSLDGLYHRGRRAPPCAIASPHPALGGSMTVPTVAELAWALTRAGFPTLRFDYRGVGASQGRDLRKPLLVVCAHHDPLCDRSRLHLPEGAQLAVIANADHGFLRGLPELGRTVAAWVESGPTVRELPGAAVAGEAGPEGFREVDLPESGEPPLDLDET